MKMAKSQKEAAGSKRGIFKVMSNYWELYLLLLPVLIWFVVFSYVPMGGLIIAFQKYSPIKGIIDSEWVGWANFTKMLSTPSFNIAFKNTIIVSVLNLLIVFPVPIVFAILLNELPWLRYKKVVQTVSYLPHFISWIIVSGLCFTMFSSVNGLLNELLLKWGWIDGPMTILTDGKQYWGLAIGTEVWKEMGWNAIIFIAAIAGIDSALYEAAQIDGASRIQRIIHVTLPGIKGTIVIMFILALGGLVNGNLDQAMMLGNTLNRDYSEIINSYVLTIGLRQFRFDYAAAVGMMQSVISVVLVFSTNALSRRTTGAALY